MNKVEFDTKVGNAKAKIAVGARDVSNFVNEHYGEIIILTPIVLGAFSLCKCGIRATSARAAARRLDIHRKLEVYDPSTGCTLRLKRALTGPEKLELARRAKGVTVTEVIDAMGLLRR